MGTRLTWRDLWTIAVHGPPTSAIQRAVNPEGVIDAATVLLREIEHNTRIAWWQNTADGQKGRRQPQPIVLFESDRPKSKFDAMTIDEAREWLGWK